MRQRMVLPVLVLLAVLAGCGKRSTVDIEPVRDEGKVESDKEKGKEKPVQPKEKEKEKARNETPEPDDSEIKKLPAPPKESKLPDALVKEIDKAGDGVKLVKLSFKVQDQEMTVDAPEGAEAREGLLGLE